MNQSHARGGCAAARASWWAALVLAAVGLIAPIGCGGPTAAPGAPASYEEAMALVKEGKRHLDAARAAPGSPAAMELEKAIEAYEAALEFLTQRNHPEDWAYTHFLLAISYAELPPEKERQNTERAIGHFQAGLHVYTEDTHPKQWAQGNLCIAGLILNAAKGDPTQDLGEARQRLEAALRVLTRESNPEDWGLTMFTLAAHAKLTEDREQAIKYSLAALGVLGKEAHPGTYAKISLLLGESLLLSGGGDRIRNLKEASCHLENALSVWTQGSDPRDYAWASYCLGACYMELPGRDAEETAQTWERAIMHFRNALRVYTEADDPEHWAAASMCLGASLAVRVHGDREANSEEARRHLEDGLRVLPEEEDLHRWGKAFLAYAVALSGHPTDSDVEEAKALLADAARALQIGAGDPDEDMFRGPLARASEQLSERAD